MMKGRPAHKACGEGCSRHWKSHCKDPKRRMALASVEDKLKVGVAKVQ